VTSDGGLLLVRELDERPGLTGLIQNHLVNSRSGRNTQFPLAVLFRQSAYSRLAGYEDLNDAIRLASDPTFRRMGSEKVWERGVALTSTLHWFETESLAREENLTGLVRLNRELVARAEGVGSHHRVVLDMDSSESPVYGEQEQSAYNGYFESVCYHPLFLFKRQGDCLAAKLRPGNVHSAEGWEELLLPEIERRQQNAKEVASRDDAAFAKPKVKLKSEISVDKSFEHCASTLFLLGFAQSNPVGGLAMAFCKACGTEVGGAAFCPKCGVSQSAAPVVAAPSSNGLGENVAGLLCYAVGWVTGIIFLLIDKRPFVKFHAAQSIVVFGALTVFRIGLGMIISVGGLVGFGLWAAISLLIGLLSLVLWIFLMIKAYQHVLFKVPVAAGIAESIAGK
jgi:uncharacterized membrane protein